MHYAYAIICWVIIRKDKPTKPRNFWVRNVQMLIKVHIWLLLSVFCSVFIGRTGTGGMDILVCALDVPCSIHVRIRLADSPEYYRRGGGPDRGRQQERESGNSRHTKVFHLCAGSLLQEPFNDVMIWCLGWHSQCFGNRCGRQGWDIVVAVNDGWDNQWYELRKMLAGSRVDLDGLRLNWSSDR